MKSLKIAILFVIVSFSAFKANAQSETFKPFKVDIAFGYAVPAGSGSKGGVLFAVEPKYAINDQITLGLRLESALTAYSFESNGQSFTGDIKSTSSYLATADYMFNTKSVRPFAGLGLGIYSVAGVSISDNSQNIAVGSTTKFGFAPRVGIETGHFRTAIEYNFAGKDNGIKYNYLAFKVGFFLGGGKK
ncbi:outer membrane beta-barrel protein [Pedobacter fastidiosus]|uniref:Outer membrane beta-barrel protein n=1 Tax=Pedobacter fastidiosus TaxID=2765361 RepID=A0ABR7KPA9_9SPHI|nr:outer membrane beta-barrel protein [Pedobacter fastidiosus]MBC6109828.1 outer membrane beta-barrel protein [Pedobacter fastidiosus]